MSPAHVLEPTYHRLKRGLMEGIWPQGSRLEALRLADDFGVSMTPVRDCLNRLVGEGLVEMRPGEGYRVTVMTEQYLRDLLEFNAALLEIALRAPVYEADRAQDEIEEHHYADQVASLFAVIAARAINGELARAVASLNDRLHIVRRLEPEFFRNAEEEIAAIGASADGNIVVLRAALADYHERRRLGVAGLIGLLN